MTPFIQFSCLGQREDRNRNKRKDPPRNLTHPTPKPRPTPRGPFPSSLLLSPRLCSSVHGSLLPQDLRLSIVNLLVWVRWAALVKQLSESESRYIIIGPSPKHSLNHFVSGRSETEPINRGLGERGKEMSHNCSFIRRPRKSSLEEVRLGCFNILSPLE